MYVKFMAPKQAFLEDMFGGVWKMTPKRPLIESKQTLFLKNRHILTPTRDLHDLHLPSKNNPFSCFSGPACVHVYNTMIWVPPGVYIWCVLIIHICKKNL